MNKYKTLEEQVRKDERSLTTHKVCYCAHCGKAKKPSQFFSTNNFMVKSGYMIYCKECLNSTVAERTASTGDVGVAIREICEAINFFYDEKKIDKIKKKLKDKNNPLDINRVFSEYKKLVSKQISQRGIDTFDQNMVLDDIVKERIEYGIKEKVIREGLLTREQVEKMVADGEFKDGLKLLVEEELDLDDEATKIKIKALSRKWSIDDDIDKLLWLEEEYKDWCSKTKVEGKSVEEKVMEICVISWRLKNEEKLSIPNYEKLSNAKSKLIKEAGLEDKNDGMSLGKGMGVGKWSEIIEYEEPVPEPGPAFLDIDGIRKLFEVYFLGHLLKMLGRKNTNINEYEEEMNKNTVFRDE